jgi:hypothetical protein
MSARQLVPLSGVFYDTSKGSPSLFSPLLLSASLQCPSLQCPLSLPAYHHTHTHTHEGEMSVCGRGRGAEGAAVEVGDVREYQWAMINGTIVRRFSYSFRSSISLQPWHVSLCVLIKHAWRLGGCWMQMCQVCRMQCVASEVEVLHASILHRASEVMPAMPSHA